MRFKTYGLCVRSSLPSNNEDDGTWCQIEFPLFEDNQSNILSLDIRFVYIFILKIYLFIFFKDYVQQKLVMRISWDLIILEILVCFIFN